MNVKRILAAMLLAFGLLLSQTQLKATEIDVCTADRSRADGPAGIPP